MFEEPVSRVLLVRYAEAKDLDVARQAPVVARLEAEPAKVALLFDVGAAVRSVAIEVPTFWLGTTGRLAPKLAGLGIIASSAGVRVAARGFMLANRVRGSGFPVELFDDVASALDWARALVR